MNRIDLRGLPLPDLTRFVTEIGLEPRVASRIFADVQRDGVEAFPAFRRVGNRLWHLLARHATIGRLHVADVLTSKDGTRKFLLRLDDGNFIEAVLIPEKDRHTLCLSSQCGCAMGCAFCCTGAMGFVRNLSAAEMVGQVLAVIKTMQATGPGRATPREYINNLVFMGMGEPLANYNNLITALSILMDDKGLGFSERRVTVSTCGLVPRLIALGRDARVNLAVSLHGADDRVRDRLMPINRTYPLQDLLGACRAYPLSGKRVILFEYILISGVNDSDEQARQLASLLSAIPCRINLLPVNQHPDLPFARPCEKRLDSFRSILHAAGFTVLLRKSRGADIGAACGQLARRKGGSRLFACASSADGV